MSFFSIFQSKKKALSEFEQETLPYFDALARSAFRLTRNQKDAEDLLQDTYFKAFKFYGHFKKGSNCKAWLFKILLNLFINEYRRRQKEPAFIDYTSEDCHQLLSEDGAVNLFQSEANYLRNMLSDKVLDALDSLPVEFRTVVVLSDINEFSYKEIANITKCPIGTVMSRLYRGRQMLKKKLKKIARENGIVDKTAPKEGKVNDLLEYKKAKDLA